MQPEPTIAVYPLTPDRWDDLVTLFGPAGAAGGCWCMGMRLANAEIRDTTAETRRAALKALADAGRPPGLLAYVDGQPAGWCGLGPRASFGRLQRSRALGPFDVEPVWSIVCFFVARQWRGQGVAAALLRAAVQWAAEQGAPALEGYPVDARVAPVPAPSAYPGTVEMFLAAGFREKRATAARARSGGAPRLVVRHDLTH